MENSRHAILIPTICCLCWSRSEGREVCFVKPTVGSALFWNQLTGRNTERQRNGTEINPQVFSLHKNDNIYKWSQHLTIWTLSKDGTLFSFFSPWLVYAVNIFAVAACRFSWSSLLNKKNKRTSQYGRCSILTPLLETADAHRNWLPWQIQQPSRVCCICRHKPAALQAPTPAEQERKPWHMNASPKQQKILRNPPTDGSKVHHK